MKIQDEKILMPGNVATDRNNFLYCNLMIMCFLLMVCQGCNIRGLIGPEQSNTDYEKVRVDARNILLQAATSGDRLTRVHAMEAIGRLGDKSMASVLIPGLDSEDPLIMFAAAMALGDIGGCPQAVGKLEQIAGNSESHTSVVCACVYALHMSGVDKYMFLLGPVLVSDSVSDKSNVAFVMGRMNEPSALTPLRTLMNEESDPRVKYNVVEALARLGDTRAIKIMESYAKGYYMDVRLAAIPVIPSIKHPRARMLLLDLLDQTRPPRVRVAAAGALGQLGIEDGYDVCVQALRTPDSVLTEQKNPDPVKNRHAVAAIASLRRLAAISLGKIGKKEGVDELIPLLGDSDGSVRIAGAMSITRILEPGGRQVVVPVTMEPGEYRGVTILMNGMYTAPGRDMN